MENVYERGELMLMVTRNPSFRDLMWACEYDGIILALVPIPKTLPPHLDSYFSGYLDALGFSQINEQQRSRIFIVMAKDDVLKEEDRESVVDKFLLGIARKPPNFIRSLNSDRRKMMDNFMSKIPDSYRPPEV